MHDISRIYLDTNIFIVAFERRDELSDRLALLFSTRQSSQTRFVTSELTLSELLVVPYRDNDDSLIDTYESLILTNNWLEVVPVAQPTLRYAAVLRSQYRSLKLPDAIHLSTAIGTNCSHILTEDRGINGEYRLQHPRYGIVTDAPSLQTIRLDGSTLTSLLKSLT
jgi:predicted nucleic acid-binding protein